MCWSVHRHKIEYIFFYSKQILYQNNSVVWEVIGSLRKKKNPKILNLSYTISEKYQNSSKIFWNSHF